MNASVQIEKNIRKFRIVARLDALQTEVDALKRLQAETTVKKTGQAPVNKNTGQAVAELDALLPAILQFSPGFDPTGDRAWTHSLPARSGFALSLREIRLARSQRARLKGEL